jgi:diguanylate cyclase (GGDEF)-like protein
MQHRFLSKALVLDVAMLTLASIAASLIATGAAMAAFAGLDLAATITVGKLWTLGMTLSVFAPLVICPLVALPGRRLLAELRRTRERLEHAASRDGLTGLLNRRAFKDAAAELLRACHEDGASAVALMCDVDFFKSINDRYGHDFGDGALERIALVIESTVGGRGAAIGRLGGEEFAVFVPNCDLSEGEKLARAICATCERQSIEFSGMLHQVTLSLGVAAIDSADEDLRSLLSRADAALYQAKRDGRNRVVTAPRRPKFSAAA